MIVCSCTHCTFPCGKTFSTLEEFKRFTRDKCIAMFPSDKILSGYQPIVTDKQTPLPPPEE